MVKTKSTVTVPKWIKESPSEEHRKLMKTYAYKHLRAIALRGENFLTATAEIPDFIKLLAQKNPKFTEIKQVHLKTTNKLIEAIRQELRHQIDRIEKEVEDGDLVYTPKGNDNLGLQDDLVGDDDNQNDGLQTFVKNDDGEIQEESSSDSDVENDVNIASPPRSSRISYKSKPISKNKPKGTLSEYGRKHSNEWMVIHYLQEAIKGKKYEIKLLELKL